MTQDQGQSVTIEYGTEMRPDGTPAEVTVTAKNATVNLNADGDVVIKNPIVGIKSVDEVFTAANSNIVAHTQTGAAVAEASKALTVEYGTTTATANGSINLSALEDSATLSLADDAADLAGVGTRSNVKIHAIESIGSKPEEIVRQLMNSAGAAPPPGPDGGYDAPPQRDPNDPTINFCVLSMTQNQKATPTADYINNGKLIGFVVTSFQVFNNSVNAASAMADLVAARRNKKHPDAQEVLAVVTIWGNSERFLTVGFPFARLWMDTFTMVLESIDAHAASIAALRETEMLRRALIGHGHQQQQTLLSTSQGTQQMLGALVNMVMGMLSNAAASAAGPQPTPMPTGPAQPADPAG